MAKTIREIVTIRTEGSIEVHSPAFVEGRQAEVIVRLEDTTLDRADACSLTWAEFWGSGAGNYKSVHDIDRHVRELREEWDR